MGYKARYFYGRDKRVDIKLPGAMVKQLEHLSVEDERPSVNRELVYLLGRKLEGIDIARKCRAEREAHRCRLIALEKELRALWKALIITPRAKDINPLLVELKPLLLQAQAVREAIDNIPDYQEAGEPGN